MLLGGSSWRVLAAVALLLVSALVATAFVSARYHREKTHLGQIYYERGRALEKEGKLDSAIEEYRKALIFSPDTPEYRVSFASALLQAGRLDEAEAHVQLLLQEDPTNGELNLLLGRIAARRGQLNKAMEYYHRAVYEYWPPQRVGERKEARIELINMLAHSGRRAELIAELMTLYANFPSDLNLHAWIGFNLLDHGATSEATQVFRQLVRVSPRNPEAHRGLAQAYFASGDYISARHEFERALRLNPKDTASANYLKLTNTVVDLDPQLTGIRETERLRRAQNLLRRVVNDISSCADPATAANNLADAQKLLASKPANTEDAAIEMQRQAVTLWSQRNRWCPGSPTADGALSTVLARISSE